ncbi:Rv0909 family putative TA system antitoxin [Agromyces archimandritae]|uniref:Antitoxin n=1 Tax=Agromyces archimandritae TaxID=2781962 RepID=A0A975IPQ4_9MICO|nr:Rv0909 family putative TA system antitoxin [Agromyces archimandritae]QTX05857.1 antitoxin [Agromyces archimandritae]
MGALDDATKKAQDFVEENKDKVQDALKSEQAEDISDKIMDGVAGAAKKVTGGKFDEQIDDARENVDKHIGNE